MPAEANPVGLGPGAIVGGKYRIDGALGTGGMGVVFAATHLELDAPVAIKVVREELTQNEAVMSRLLFEARSAARMRSHHIVRVLDVGRLETGAPYIVMEQLHGSDLAAVLDVRHSLPMEEAILYVVQACEGLAEAHAIGIVHLDLKPENLFLAATPEGDVLKILDFGISKDICATAPAGGRPTLSKPGSAVGSPFYMSPEQMSAAPKLNARADIWALGAILFELLTGKCPFEANTPALLCSKVMTEPAPSLCAYESALPAGLDAIVQRCLMKDPNARYQTVTQLADALRDFLIAEAAEQADARRSTPVLELTVDSAEHHLVPAAEAVHEPAVPREKKSTLAWLAVGSLALLMGLAGFLWHGERDTSSPAASKEVPLGPPRELPAESVRPTHEATSPARVDAPAPILAAPALAPISVTPEKPAAKPGPALRKSAQPPSATRAPTGTATASPGSSALKRAEPAPTFDPDSTSTRYGL